MEVVEVGVKRKYRTRDVLLVASYFTKTEGYHPVSSGKDSTKEKVLLYLNNHSSVEELLDYQSRAEAMIQWVKGEKSSDWVDNIRSAMGKKEVDDSAIGLLSSAFSGYDHYMKKQDAKEDLKKSEYQGNPKDKITIDVKYTKHITSGKSKFDENKEFHIFQIVDNSNNVYIWFADKYYKDDLKKSKKIGAVVKSHNEREGIKQTIVFVNSIQ